MPDTATRTVLRFALDDRDDEGVATVFVGPNPKVVYAGPGTSPHICAWVECDDVRYPVNADAPDEGTDMPTAQMVPLRIAFVATGGVVPDGGTWLNMVPEAGPTGFALRHLYLLP